MKKYQPIIEMVVMAGQIVFDKALRSSVEMKGKADFVTAVDLKISEFIKKNLAVFSLPPIKKFCLFPGLARTQQVQSAQLHMICLHRRWMGMCFV